MGKIKSDKKKIIKAKLMRKQKNCFYCGCILTKENRSIDHVFPKVHGGKSIKGNLVLSCKSCNNKKGESKVIPNYYPPVA